MKALTITFTTIMLTGCFATTEKVHDFVKDVEGKAYDSLAAAVDKYCSAKKKDGTLGKIAMKEALELRRELRQRGDCEEHAGPQGPAEKPELLDDKTAYGCGGVVRIWCAGEVVPPEIWNDFIRIK